MKKLLVSNSNLKLLIDDEDYIRASHYNWVFTYDYRGSKIGASVNKKHLEIGRFILNSPEGMLVDHKDCNIFNNQKSNLRIANHQQNAQNKSKQFSPTTSSYKGVSWRSDRKKWRSYIVVNYQQESLGHFNSEIEAAKAYDVAAIKHFGEFANLNFPEVKL